LLLSLSWLDCITNTSGYDFRKGQVADGKSLLTGNGRYGEIGILHQSLLKIMGTRNDPEQTGIGSPSVIGVVHDQLHFADDLPKSRLHL
jgi:hypothetical protein